MKLFTVGPVEMYPQTLKIESEQLPYFRTPEFSSVMKNIETNFLKTVFAPEGTLFSLLTCSGSGAMEASVINTLNRTDKVLIINGGSFGNRFKEICKIHEIPFEEYIINYEESFNKEHFEKYSECGFTALLVNACETSTCQKYDLKYLGDFCKRNNMLFIVDAVSAYLADYINLKEHNIDILFTASQKALALSPGTALFAISEKAYRTHIKGSRKSLYFDFNDYILNQKRGQTPFTPSVGTVLALNERLNSIISRGVENEIALHKERAEYFRNLVRELPVSLPDYELSNCCTAIFFKNDNAMQIYENLKEKHGIVLTPSGGSIKNRQLRVGHIGNLSFKDYDILVEKLKGELKQ